MVHDHRFHEIEGQGRQFRVRVSVWNAASGTSTLNWG